jgi:hypothetical protein
VESRLRFALKSRDPLHQCSGIPPNAIARTGLEPSERLLLELHPIERLKPPAEARGFVLWALAGLNRRPLPCRGNPGGLAPSCKARLSAGLPCATSDSDLSAFRTVSGPNWSSRALSTPCPAIASRPLRDLTENCRNAALFCHAHTLTARIRQIPRFGHEWMGGWVHDVSVGGQLMSRDIGAERKAVRRIYGLVECINIPGCRPVIGYALRVGRANLRVLAWRGRFPVSAEHIAGKTYPLRYSGGATSILGGRQRARFPQNPRFRVENGTLAHMRSGNCTEVDTPLAGHALPEIRPRLVFGETECRLWAGKPVTAHG